MRCGFVGLGIMGRAMATNLLAAGHDVAGWNRSPAPAKALAEAGARVAPSPRDAAEGAEVVLCCLADDTAVREVVLGDDGVREGLGPGAVLVDLSTVSPATALALHAGVREVGADALDAPVSGGEQGAREATLAIMVGGEPAALERARPALDAIGAVVEHVGPPGAGQTTKAVNQLLVGGVIGVVSEALSLLSSQSLDADAATRVLAAGLGGNRVLDRRGDDMRARRFEPGARADLHRKDLAIVRDLAADAGVPLPITAVVSQLYEALHAQGRGGLDHTALLAVLDDLAGR